MMEKMKAIVASALMSLVLVLPVSAQQATFDLSTLPASGGSAGSQCYTTARTGANAWGVSQAHVTGYTTTQSQNPFTLPVVSTAGLAPVFGVVGYGFGGPFSGASFADYIDSPNVSDSMNNDAALQAIVAQEQAVEAQGDADAAGGGGGGF